MGSIEQRRTPAHTALNAARDGWGTVHCRREAASPAPPDLPATWWPGWGLGVAHAEDPRVAMWHPEVPWPRQRYLTASPEGAGESQAAQPRGQMGRWLPSTETDY
ncbi:hypothetical protein [Oryza sativa Japonica Group]|uniref:Uncharacterized protein n=1 Tax=Oryza sativa subsp. japonica TaxID=39947 RepID=Q5VN90_ORYSJ|nr:hypothetical protein [Oryza sativa Japonica Group]